MSETRFFGYDLHWLGLALGLLAAAVYVATCRHLLQVFSRKALLERVPEAERPGVEKYLGKQEDYAATLRGIDLFLRLGLVLSLTFGRWSAMAEVWTRRSFGGLLIDFGLLGLEMLFTFVLFLEIVPGIIARVRPEGLLMRRLRVIDWTHRVVGPVRSVLSSFTRRVVAALGGKAERLTADILEEEILTAAEESAKEGLIKSRDLDMIESIITFGDVEVSEVMTPRTEMVCLDVEDPLHVSLRRAVECGHSRIPMYKDTKDNIVGILYVKDLLRYWDRRDSIAFVALARKPHFVPLTKKIGELLQEFKTQRFHIAIVLDEFGGTAGLITIEDIIEEIVGEITDEHERIERPAFKRIEPGVVEVDGSYHIDDLNAELGTEVPEDEAYDTIGGLLLTKLGRMPAVGDTFEHDMVRFEVIAADGRRVRRLRVHHPAKEAAAPSSSAGAVETRAKGLDAGSA